MANRKRKIKLDFCVTEHERDLIRRKMAQLSTSNFGAYARKMLIDGYVISVDMTCFKELVLLLRNCSNNMNQIAHRVNSTGNFYAEDVEDIKDRYNQLWDVVKDIIVKLEKL